MEWHRNLASSSKLASQHQEVCEEDPVRAQKSSCVEMVKNKKPSLSSVSPLFRGLGNRARVLQRVQYSSLF